MSWIPEAKVSRVGARVVVIWERRDDMLDGVRGRGVGDCDCWGSWLEGCCGWGCSEAKIACWEGFRRDLSISDSGCVEVDSGCDDLALGGCFCGLIEGIAGGRRSSFNECFSRCNLYHISKHAPKIKITNL